MKTLTERSEKTKNLGLPFKSEEKSPLFLSVKASGSPFNFGGNMVEYFKVRPQDGKYQVYYQDNPKSRKLPIVTFDSYLLAKIRAYNGNRIMANTESEFAELVGVK